MPHQYGSLDCGVFVMAAGWHLLTRTPMRFSQQHMPEMRRGLARQLMATTKGAFPACQKMLWCVIHLDYTHLTKVKAVADVCVTQRHFVPHCTALHNQHHTQLVYLHFKA